MAVVTDRDNGLFPHPGEISLHCTCPDWAVMCKHVAAVLYGVGARLDEKPELLFLLRGLDHEELISAEAGIAAVSNASLAEGHPRIAESDLSHLFGIEITAGDAAAIAKPAPKLKSKPLDKRMKLPKAIDTPRKKREKDRAGLDRERSRLGLASKKSQASDKKAMPGARKTVVVTGKAVASLRKKLNMSQAGLARLLDVAPATVGNWEKSEGPLNLRASTRKAWEAVSKLKKKG
jgi:DNA-binding transcriptional regulator YiaG